MNWNESRNRPFRGLAVFAGEFCKTSLLLVLAGGWVPGLRGPRRGQLATQIAESIKSITTVLLVFNALRSSTLAKLEER